MFQNQFIKKLCALSAIFFMSISLTACGGGGGSSSSGGTNIYNDAPVMTLEGKPGNLASPALKSSQAAPSKALNIAAIKTIEVIDEVNSSKNIPGAIAQFGTSGDNFTITIPCLNDSASRFATIVAKDAKGIAIYKNMIGKIPKTSEVKKSFKISGIKLNDETTARTVLICAEKNNIPNDPPGFEDFDLSNNAVTKFEYSCSQKINNYAAKIQAIKNAVNSINMVNSNLETNDLQVSIEDIEKILKSVINITKAYSNNDTKLKNIFNEKPEIQFNGSLISDSTEEKSITEIIQNLKKDVKESVQKPVFTPAGGNYNSIISVFIRTETPGAKIYIAFDESNYFTEYLSEYPIEMLYSGKIKAYAYKDGMANSETVIENYVINPQSQTFSLATVKGSWMGSFTVYTTPQQYGNLNITADESGNINGTIYNNIGAQTALSGTIDNSGKTNLIYKYPDDPVSGTINGTLKILEDGKAILNFDNSIGENLFKGQVTLFKSYNWKQICTNLYGDYSYSLQSSPSGTISYNNKLWSATIESNGQFKIYNSNDGIKWQKVNQVCGIQIDDTMKTLFSFLTFNNRMWIITFGKIYSSNDGATWIQHTNKAEFGERYGFSCCEFNGKLWLTGGVILGNEYLDQRIYQQDSWYSTDGIKWVKAAEKADYNKIFSHYMIKFQNKLWIIGSSSATNPNGTEIEKAIWNSSDGIKWNKIQSNLNFNSIVVSGCTVYNGKIHVLVKETPISGDINLQSAKHYVSSDGCNWSLALANLIPNHFENMLEFNNSLYCVDSCPDSFMPQISVYKFE